MRTKPWLLALAAALLALVLSGHGTLADTGFTGTPGSGITSNHTQGTTANAVAANPVLSPTLSFTCLGAAKLVHVEATANPIQAATGAYSSQESTMTLLLDGSAVAGAPTPGGLVMPPNILGNSLCSGITMTWDVSFPDNGAHTLGVQVAGSFAGVGGALSLGPGTIHAQELPN